MRPAITVFLFFIFSGSYSQPTLKIFADRGFEDELLNSLKREFSEDFKVNFKFIEVEDIGVEDIEKDGKVVKSVIDGSLLTKHKICKEDSTYYLFLTNSKLFWKSRPSNEIRGISNTKISLGVISSYRIKNESDSLSLPYHFQLIKAVKHEYLHLLGLDHCDTTKRCLMVSSFPPSNFYNSFDRICSFCMDKINPELVNQSLLID